MLRDDPTPPARYAPDMLADPAMRAISAAVIRIFERLGWAAKVRWPTPAHLDSRRRDEDGKVKKETLRHANMLPVSGKYLLVT